MRINLIQRSEYVQRTRGEYVKYLYPVLFLVEQSLLPPNQGYYPILGTI
jgi:hypothetical protein